MDGIRSLILKILTALNSHKWFPIKADLESQLQFVEFCIVGVSNTVISYLIYSVSLLLFRRLHLFENYDYFVAQILMFVLSVAWSFYWNNRMVFRLKTNQKRSLFKSLVKTYISYSFTGLLLNSILLWLWVRVLGISAFIAPVLNLFISIPVNFILNKYWAFKAE